MLIRDYNIILQVVVSDFNIYYPLWLNVYLPAAYQVAKGFLQAIVNIRLSLLTLLELKTFLISLKGIIINLTFTLSKLENKVLFCLIFKQLDYKFNYRLILTRLVASLTLAPKRETKLQKKVNLEVIKAIAASSLPSPISVVYKKPKRLFIQLSFQKVLIKLLRLQCQCAAYCLI